MDIAAMDEQLRRCRQQKRWGQAVSVLDAVLQDAAGETRGWALVQLAATLFSQSPRYALRALRLTDEALDLLAGNHEWVARTVIQGMNYAEFAGDTPRYDKYATAAKRLLNSSDPVVVPWRGRLHNWLGYYNQKQGRLEKAIDHLRKAAAFYRNNVGPYGQHDQQCQLMIALAALGDAFLASGDKAKAAASLRLALQERTDTDPGTTAYLSGRIAEAEDRVGDAGDAYLNAMRLAGEVSDHPMVLKAARALAGIYKQTGQYEKAAGILQPLIHEAALGRMVQVVLQLQRLQSAIAGGEVASC